LETCEDFCSQIKDKIRFIHLENWPGYKAGALNYGLSVTNKKADIIAIIDSDYKVDATWLKKTVPFFSDSSVAVVQAPQDYVNLKLNAFEKMIYNEYVGFFKIGMVQRNEHNAIIQHGTMTLIKKRHPAQSWWLAENSITEDAELGLRILEKGYNMFYVSEVLGKGIVPPSFDAYKKQRFRWVYGAVRILMNHRKSFFSSKSKLTFRQKYDFMIGWLPWLIDSLYPLFCLIMIIWTIILIVNPFISPLLPLCTVYFPSIFQNYYYVLAYKKRVKLSFIEIFLQ